MRVADPTTSNQNLKNIYDKGITALGVARDFILPEFVKNPADATFASIGVDLVTMFPMARIFKGGKIAGEYLRTIDRMGINDIKQELNRLNKARAVNRKNIFASGKSPEQIKKLEAEELELSNTIVKKLGNRRDQLRKLETAEKIMGGDPIIGDGSKTFRRFANGGGVGSFFTSLYNDSVVADPDDIQDIVVVGTPPEPINIDYGRITDLLKTGLDIYNILNPTPPIVYPQQQPQAQQQMMGLASLMPESLSYNFGGGSDIRLADYLTELERRAALQKLLTDMMG